MSLSTLSGTASACAKSGAVPLRVFEGSKDQCGPKRADPAKAKRDCDRERIEAERDNKCDNPREHVAYVSELASQTPVRMVTPPCRA